MATQLDRILDSTSLKSEARAAAINDLAARLKRTPQTIRNHLRKYGRRRLVRDLLRDDSGRGPRLSSEAETIVRTVLDDKYLTPEGCQQLFEQAGWRNSEAEAEPGQTCMEYDPLVAGIA